MSNVKKEYFDSDLEDEAPAGTDAGYDSEADNLRPDALEAADRPLTAAERDQQDAMMSDEALRAETQEQFDTVTYVGRMAITPEALESKAFKEKDRFEFSTDLGNISIDDVLFSNAEDQSPEMRDLGACDLIKSIDLSVRHSVDGAKFTAEFPTVPLSEREKTPGARIAHVSMPLRSNATEEHWERAIATGAMAYALQFPGHTEQTIARTITSPAVRVGGPAPAFKRIQVSPVLSPVLDYYNALVDQENATLATPKYARLDASKADELGEVAGIADLVDRAAAAAGQHQKEHLPYGNVTNPAVFRLVLRAERPPTYNVATGKYEKTVANLATLHEEKFRESNQHLALKAHGLTAPASAGRVSRGAPASDEKTTRAAIAAKKYEAMLKAGKQKPYEVNFVATIKYRKCAPNYKA